MAVLALFLSTNIEDSDFSLSSGDEEHDDIHLAQHSCSTSFFERANKLMCNKVGLCNRVTASASPGTFVRFKRYYFEKR